MKTADLIDKIVALALSKKAQNIIILDLKKITEIFDSFIIFSSTSSRHVKILTDYIAEELKKDKIKPLSREGSPQSGWVLLDYGDVVIHIFLEETRNFYQIERLFKDAKMTKIES
ncbi:MAG: ribosome silencing factor [Actinobacteria bacterium]|nr:MAG: ribosome silencing factor [Actinomycetota bacterium]